MSKNPQQGSPFPKIQKEKIPGGFRRRLWVAVSVLFLTTMVLFLSVSFFSERNLHYQDTFEHLDETLGILTVLVQTSKGSSPEILGKVESLLEKRTRVTHRVFLTNDDSLILGSSDPDLINQNIKVAFNMKSFERGNPGWSTATRDGKDWLVSATDHLFGESEKGVIFLMRWRRSSEQFVGKFLRIHGLHAAVTLILFFLLFHWLGGRYVRKPIQRLADHIRRVETGNFKVGPEVESDDEFGWLARRFHQMGKTLNETVQRLVRTEKYATVSVIAFRIAREMKEPIEAWNRHILYLEGLAKKDSEMNKVGAALRVDRLKVMEVIRQLNEIRPYEKEESLS
jgi:HAMP domain-containing protein